VQCICAECALHGEHRGHDVLNVRQAARGLKDRAEDLAGSVRARMDALSGEAQRAKEAKREFSEIVLQAKRDLRGTFERLRLVLAEEEKALSEEVERCATEIEVELGGSEEHPSEVHAREAHSMLQSFHREGDAIQALNWYGKAKEALANLPSASPANEAVTFGELKDTLQRGFDARVTNLAAFGQRIADLQAVQLAQDVHGNTIGNLLSTSPHLHTQPCDSEATQTPLGSSRRP